MNTPRLFFSKFFSSFKYAAGGLKTLLTTQRNARIHLLATIVVVATGVFFGLSRGDWCLVIFACALVWAAEALNTALEFLCDVVTREEHPLIGAAKDVAAGGVLLCAIAAVIVGVLVFWPHLAAHFSRL